MYGLFQALAAREGAGADRLVATDQWLRIKLPQLPNAVNFPCILRVPLLVNKLGSISKCQMESLADFLAFMGNGSGPQFTFQALQTSRQKLCECNLVQVSRNLSGNSEYSLTIEPPGNRRFVSQPRTKWAEDKEGVCSVHSPFSFQSNAFAPSFQSERFQTRPGRRSLSQLSLTTLDPRMRGMLWW